MLAVVSAAGLAGFFVSALLLWLGVTHMAVRYGIACVVGYACFLSLMRAWLRRWVWDRDQHSLVETTVDAVDVASPWLRLPTTRSGSSGGWMEGGRSGGGGASATFASAGTPPPVPIITAPVSSSSSSSSSWSDVDLDVDVKLLPLLAVVAMVAGLVTAGAVVWQAPHLLAEIIVDAALAGAAYGRLRRMHVDWTFGIIRRTWVPMLLITVLMVALGWVGQHLRPSADSIGDFFR